MFMTWGIQDNFTGTPTIKEGMRLYSTGVQLYISKSPRQRLHTLDVVNVSSTVNALNIKHAAGTLTVMSVSNAGNTSIVKTVGVTGNTTLNGRLIQSGTPTMQDTEQLSMHHRTLYHSH